MWLEYVVNLKRTLPLLWIELKESEDKRLQFLAVTSFSFQELRIKLILLPECQHFIEFHSV